MSTHSCPMSSSPARSPLPEPPSCSSSSSSSSSSTSSSNKVISVGAVGNAAPPMEKARGDDVGNVLNRSISCERLRPHMASIFHTDALVAEFLNNVPVLKAFAEESFLAFGPCSLADRMYRELSSTEPPFFFYV